MGHDGGQKKVGTNYIPGSGSSDKGSPSADPLSGNGRNTQTSTHTDFHKESIKENSGGKIIEGQHLRGYVLNDGGTNIGAVDDATVAPDGTNRVKSL